MSRSPKAIVRNSIRVCQDATTAAHALEREGRFSDARAILRLVYWHAQAAKLLRKETDK